MADVKISMDDRAGQSSILDDFCYNNNVSKANVYVRLGFLRKVYGILSIQLLATTMIAAFGMFTPAVKLYISQNHWMVGGSVLPVNGPPPGPDGEEAGDAHKLLPPHGF
ncbi:hypothetical protein MTO96_040790, partial [Rhipicephalus appendiculatus]